jgi:hypothetical protein
MFGELKTINVWVSGGWEPRVSLSKKRGEKEWF